MTITDCPAQLAQKEFTQYYPKPGWVEHDPEEIWSTQAGVSLEAITKAGIESSDIAAIGITNQRETTVVWNRKTGKPVYNAIVWQDRRTADFCDSLKREGKSSMILEKTGLIIDAYFSATKIKWILDNVEGARKLADRRTAGIWYRRFMAGMESDQWRVAYNRCHKCFQDNAV